MDSNALNEYGINEKNLSLVSDWAKDYAVSKGILMRNPNYSEDTRVLLPFCVIPSKVPEKWYNLVYELQPHLNEVLLKISHSREFLKQCFESVLEADEYTANIYRIYEAVENQNNKNFTLGLLRSDYLLDCDCDSSEKVTGIKQVENNAIATSFGGLAPAVQDLHKYILKRLGKKSLISKLPGNNSLKELSLGLIAAWEAYGNPNASILFVVEEKPMNVCDQRILEHTIVEFNCDIKILRHPFKYLRTSATIKDNILFVDNEEVAVVYYRTGYVPDDYIPQDWDTRLLMEKSNAIKCPSAGLHLAASKRMQSLLTRPGIMEKFVNSDVAEKLRQVFAKQYTLNKEDNGDEAISLGIKNPTKYVLKPERDGGGNNIYGPEVKQVLEKIKATNERDAYILMERINPPFLPNCIIKRDKVPEIQHIICEIGIYGVILGNKEEMKLNKSAGQVLRSKESFNDEGGIVAGFGALDSPLLV